MNKIYKIENSYIVVSILIMLILIVGTLLRSQAPFWDEAYYLENVTLLNKLGFTEQFLIDYKGPAGPTFGVIHYFIQGITKLEAPIVRLVNILFLCGTLSILYKIFLNLNLSKFNSIVFALSSLAIPTIYTISGLVLTEIFATFFLAISLYFISNAYQNNKNNYWLALVAGLSFSFAILGRQPMLVLWLALPVLFIRKEKPFGFDFSKKEFLKFIVVTVSTSLILPLWVFYIWGNIQPASEAFTGVGLSATNLILAFGYAAIYTIFINHTYFDLKIDFSNKKELLLVFLISGLINVFFLRIEFAPFTSIISRFLPSPLVFYYKLCCGSVLSILGISFVYFFLKKQLKQKDKLSVFFLIGFFLIIATSVKVTHQFSARYVAQGFPLIILGLNMKRKNISWVSILMLLIGGVLGLLSLNSYFN